MSKNMSKVKIVLFFTAVVLANMAVMGEFFIYPVIDAMYENYSDSESLMNFYVSLPQIMTVVFSFVAPVLIRKTSSKMTLIIGGILFTLGGALTSVSDNLVVMSILRVPYGAGIAFCTVASVAAISEMYLDEAQRGFMIGLYSALQAGVGSVMSILAGTVAVSGWKNVFPLFWLGIPMTLMFVFFVPKMKGEEVGGDSVSTSRKKEPYGIHFIIMTIAFVLFTATIGVPNSYISTYVIENSLGNEALAGLLGSTQTMAGMFIGFLFGFMYKKLGGKVAVPWYGITVIAMLALGLVFNVPCTFFWVVILGGAMAIACSYSYAHIPAIVPASRIDDAIGVMSAACCIGYAISPYILSFTKAVTGSGKMSVSLITCALIAFVAMALEIGNNIVMEKEKAEAENQAGCHSV